MRPSHQGFTLNIKHDPVKTHIEILELRYYTIIYSNTLENGLKNKHFKTRIRTRFHRRLNTDLYFPKRLDSGPDSKCLNADLIYPDTQTVTNITKYFKCNMWHFNSGRLKYLIKTWLISNITSKS